VLFGTPHEDVVLWDVATGKEVQRFRGHRFGVDHLAFSPDSLTLVAVDGEARATVWDLTGGRSPGKRRALTPARLHSLWDALRGTDAARARRAVWALAGAGDSALPLLRRGLRPARDLGPAVRRLLPGLDDDDFEVREKATGALASLGLEAAPWLREALGRKPSPEARQRIGKVLESLGRGGPPPEALRAVRAVGVLEHLGTPAARRLLRELAGGGLAAPLTQEAREVLRRLARQARSGRR
jgi:hypothetical protein